MVRTATPKSCLGDMRIERCEERASEVREPTTRDGANLLFLVCARYPLHRTYPNRPLQPPPRDTPMGKRIDWYYHRKS